MSNTNPLVSVCIPAYNHEKYIEDCIQSIIDQTYDNIELIVVDDGSRDGTWERLKSLKAKCEKRFKRVVFEHQENQGTCITSNRLASLAAGKYIYFIASDDVSKPSAIVEEIQFLEKNPDYVLCVGDNEIIDSMGKRIGWDRKRKAIPLQEGYQTFATYLMSKKRNPNFASKDFGSYASLVRGNYIVNGGLIRKEAFDKIGGYTLEAPLEDWYLMLQLSKYGKFKFINEILFSYRWHDDNTTKKRTKMEDFQRKTELYEEKLLRNKYPHLLSVFYKGRQKEKRLLDLSPILTLRKVKDLHHKRIILTLFGFSMTLYKKTF